MRKFLGAAHGLKGIALKGGALGMFVCCMMTECWSRNLSTPQRVILKLRPYSVYGDGLHEKRINSLKSHKPDRRICLQDSQGRVYGLAVAGKDTLGQIKKKMESVYGKKVHRFLLPSGKRLSWQHTLNIYKIKEGEKILVLFQPLWLNGKR